MATVVEPQLLNLERAARYVGLSQGSFRSVVIEQSGVRVLKLGVGGAIKRIRVADLDAWITAAAEAPPPPVVKPPAPEPLDPNVEDYP
jgi:hypothetical protein